MDLTSASVHELAVYLASRLPSEFEIMEEFPTNNQSLKYPTISLSPARAQIELKYPEFDSFTDKPNTVATIISLYRVANVKVPIQLDLFCMSSDQRKHYAEIITNCLFQNPARTSDINLNLTAHHNMHANYQIDGDLGYRNTGSEAIVSDFRVKYDLLCTTELAVTKEEYKLLHLYLHTKVYRSLPDPTTPETYQVF